MIPKAPTDDKFTALEKEIERYRSIAFSLNDQLTVDRIKTAIAQLEAQKKALYAEQE
jgi:hypothetical protein